MFDENGTRILTNIQFHQYQKIEGVHFHTAFNVAACIALFTLYIGSRPMKTPFAYVDRTENFTFTFQPGFDDSDVYPGMLLSRKRSYLYSRDALNTLHNM